jgi:FkbM family methyltransferase
MTTVRPTANILTRLQRRISLEYETLIQPVVDVEIEGVKMRADQRISKWIRQALRRGYYEQLEIQLLKQKLTENDIVMEVGAGIGFISTYCAKKIGSERVFAYEANPSIESYIRETYRLNKVCPTLEMCMIGENDGEQTFYIDEHFTASSAIQHNRKSQASNVSVKSFNHEAKRLTPTFLIVDVEGYEYEFCQYANFDNIQKILLELHENILGQSKSEAVKDKLAKAGFVLTEEISVGEVVVLFLERTRT